MFPSPAPGWLLPGEALLLSWLLLFPVLPDSLGCTDILHVAVAPFISFAFIVTVFLEETLPALTVARLPLLVIFAIFILLLVHFILDCVALAGLWPA